MDINRFLAWKDRHGKTIVHSDEYSDSHLQRTANCKCPKRLAFKTVDSYIGKLRAIFKETGRGGKWNSMLGLGNPAASPEVQKYLKHQQRNNCKPASRQSKQSPYSCQNCCFWPVFWIGKSPRTQLILLTSRSMMLSVVRLTFALTTKPSATKNNCENATKWWSLKPNIHRRTYVLHIIDLSPLVTVYTQLPVILLATKQTTYAWRMSQTKDKNNGIYEVICSSTSVNCSILWKI